MAKRERQPAMQIFILATADARGHLMRTQLLYHALRQQGVKVTVMTTSDNGVDFLAAFDVPAQVLSRHYAVQFDAQQNMLQAATDRRIASYVLLPQHMLRDMWRLRRLCRGYDLVINDSFHPALLFLGTLPSWRQRVVHVFGGTLRRALEHNFERTLPQPIAKLFGGTVAWVIHRARWLEHDFAAPLHVQPQPRGCLLPTPVAVPTAPLEGQTARATPYDAAVYLNPHFSDPALAQALEQAFVQQAWSAHLVGEGYPTRAAWRAHDAHWVDALCSSRVLVCAPGMAGLSAAHIYGKPLILILTQQPEQRANAAQVAQLGLVHRVVEWRGNAAQFEADFTQAMHAMRAAANNTSKQQAGIEHARLRLQLWVETLLQFVERRLMC